MKFTATTLLLSSFAALVFGQEAAQTVQSAGLSLTNPIQNTTAYLGKDFAITWTLLENPAANINSIALMDGDATVLTTVIPDILSAPIPSSSLGYTWSVPSNLTIRQDYVLAFFGDNGFNSYSAYFSIAEPTAETEVAATTTQSSKPLVTTVNGQRCIMD